MTATRDKPALLYALVTAALLAEWGATRSAAFARGGIVPLAVFADVAVLMPLVFVFAVLRPAERPLLDVAPVLALGAAAAGLLLRSRPETKALLGVAGGLAELAVLTLLVRRLRAAARELRGIDTEDFLARMNGLSDPMLRVAGAELAVLYYALWGPRVRRPLRSHEFSYGEKTGLGGLLFGVGVMTSMEGLAAHFLLSSTFPRAAWALAAFNVYALLFMTAAFHAARLRPVALSAEHLLVRTSLLWTVLIPRRAILAVARIEETPRGAGVLRAALGAPAQVLVTLREPVVARGPLGIRRHVIRVALYVDEPERLRAALGEG